MEGQYWGVGSGGRGSIGGLVVEGGAVSGGWQWREGLYWGVGSGGRGGIGGLVVEGGAVLGGW